MGFCVELWLKVRSDPAIDESGSVYFGSYDRNIYKVDINGRQQWKVFFNHLVGSCRAGHLASWCTTSVSIGAKGTFESCLYPNPSACQVLRAQVSTGGAVYGPVTLDKASHTLYVGSFDSNLYAIDTNGTVKVERPQI